MESIKQHADFDCALAAITMAVDGDYDSLWPEDFRQLVEKSKGAYGENLQRAFQLAGMIKDVNYSCVYVGDCRRIIADMLWRRRAIVQLVSLNTENAQHLIYWDGFKVHDPSNRQVYQWANQLAGAEYVWLFNETPRQGDQLE